MGKDKKEEMCSEKRKKPDHNYPSTSKSQKDVEYFKRRKVYSPSPQKSSSTFREYKHHFGSENSARRKLDSKFSSKIKSNSRTPMEIEKKEALVKDSVGSSTFKRSFPNHGKVSEKLSENFKSQIKGNREHKANFKDPNPSSKREDRASSSDSEEEIMFDWKSYQWQLNKLFFSEWDIIKKGTELYDDFWKFLNKYQALQKQSKIRSMCNKSNIKSENVDGNSNIFNLPLKYDKKHSISFCLNMKEISDLEKKLPPVDLEDKKAKRLSKKKLCEFKFIIILYLDFVQKQKFEKLRKLRESQKSLPIAEYRTKILDTVKENNVIIIAGDTGCGKSTQIPQYLLAAGYVHIACTQPRRIACISLCKRVAYETLNEYGSSVGYQIRFEKSKTEHTKVVFMTEGLLLRQVSSDPLFQSHNVVILDEIHERHLQTDFLLGIVKCLIVQRSDIKIILMSATINISLFHNYFMGKAPVIQIPGRLYPIELKYFPIGLVEKSDKINPAPYVRILQLIDSKYPADERGDLLVFLSGMREISTVVEAAQLYAQQSNKWIILPLHSTLSISEQEKVFDISPEGIRKCIVSTNIAETSITIDGVRFVADSGKVKEMSYDPVNKMQKLKEFWISQASAEQRKGRAGRTGPGLCFRLYSEAEYSSFSRYSSPEILRVPLDSLILQMISMGLPNIRYFPFIEPPTLESLNSSLKSLKSHSALTSNEELTSIGQLLAQLPLDVTLGKMLIMGSLFHQLGPVLSLAAAMSVQSPFTNRAYRDPDCALLNKALQSDHGDPFTLLSAYREWLYVKTGGRDDSRRWCKKRGLEEQRFYEMTKLRQQFAQMLQESGMQNLCANKAPVSHSERTKRHGELHQLKQMKRELFKQGPRKAQLLKVDHGLADDDENERDVGLELKDIDFKIRYDEKRLKELYEDSNISTFKDVILLKIILCCGLYPNIAIADDHNNYKAGSEQVFHTMAKPFVILHPNSFFASDPEVLQLSQPEIVELPGFTPKNPCSSKHQLLAFVSLLETNKPYLVDSLRAPVAQTLLLFAHNVDSNADMSILVCDNFIELTFAEPTIAQNVIFQAVHLRSKWRQLLELRISAANPTIENQDEIFSKTLRIEKELSVGLIDIYLSEPLYSVKRLLAADVKLLHYGPGPGDMVLCSNPFDVDDKACIPHSVKGGVILTEFLTYNCLIDVKSSVTSITSFDSICPYCDQELHLSTLERLLHMGMCVDKLVSSQTNSEKEDIQRMDPNKKEFVCEICKNSYYFSIKDIFMHRKSHKS